MRRLILLAAALIPLTGCLVIERTRLEINFAKMTGELRFLNIGTDDANNAQSDFAELINNHVKGTQLETDNPGWNISSKELYEENGALNAVAKFGFSTLDAVKVYKHDKKSPYFYCIASGETLLSTNGTKIPAISSCVALDKKQKTLVVEAKKGDLGNGRSLLPEYKAWDGGPVAGGSGGLGDLSALTSSLESLGQALGGLGGGELAEPWKSITLPTQDGSLMFSDAKTASWTYSGARALDLGVAYSQALRVWGCTEATPMTQGAAMYGWTCTKEGQGYGVSATESAGMTIVTLEHYAL